MEAHLNDTTASVELRQSNSRSRLGCFSGKNLSGFLKRAKGSRNKLQQQQSLLQPYQQQLQQQHAGANEKFKNKNSLMRMVRGRGPKQQPPTSQPQAAHGQSGARYTARAAQIIPRSAATNSHVKKKPHHSFACFSYTSSPRTKNATWARSPRRSPGTQIPAFTALLNDDPDPLLNTSIDVKSPKPQSEPAKNKKQEDDDMMRKFQAALGEPVACDPARGTYPHRFGLQEMSQELFSDPFSLPQQQTPLQRFSSDLQVYTVVEKPLLTPPPPSNMDWMMEDTTNTPFAIQKPKVLEPQPLGTPYSPEEFYPDDDTPPIDSTESSGQDGDVISYIQASFVNDDDGDDSMNDQPPTLPPRAPVATYGPDSPPKHMRPNGLLSKQKSSKLSHNMLDAMRRELSVPSTSRRAKDKQRSEPTSVPVAASPRGTHGEVNPESLVPGPERKSSLTKSFTLPVLLPEKECEMWTSQHTIKTGNHSIQKDPSPTSVFDPFSDYPRRVFRAAAAAASSDNSLRRLGSTGSNSSGTIHAGSSQHLRESLERTSRSDNIAFSRQVRSFHARSMTDLVKHHSEKMVDDDDDDDDDGRKSRKHGSASSSRSKKKEERKPKTTRRKKDPSRRRNKLLQQAQEMEEMLHASCAATTISVGTTKTTATNGTDASSESEHSLPIPTKVISRTKLSISPDPAEITRAMPSMHRSAPLIRMYNPSAGISNAVWH